MPTMKALFWTFSVESVLLRLKSMILGGISGGYAVYTIYLHCKKLWGGHLGRSGKNMVCMAGISMGEVKDIKGVNPESEPLDEEICLRNNHGQVKSR